VHPGWWSGLAGSGGAADPSRFRIMGIDFIADDLGEIAPTTQDQAAAVACALDALGVPRAHALVGASYGGMVALAFAEPFPERVDRLVIVSADAVPHPSATAARELQRRVVKLGLEQGRGEEALAIARGMAMLTYRSPEEFADRFEGGIREPHTLACSQPGAYLRARGEAFPSVMSPQRFLSLSASIDRHRVGPARINTPALLIGAASDQLVLPSQMQALADRLGGPSELHLLPSLYGHDMFLKETDKLSALAGPFLAR
jgi:homoserine O-acetyltransferase